MWSALEPWVIGDSSAPELQKKFRGAAAHSVIRSAAKMILQYFRRKIKII